MIEAASLRLRPAEPADAASIARINAQDIEDRVATFETEPPSETELAAPIQRERIWRDVVIVERLLGDAAKCHEPAGR